MVNSGYTSNTAEGKCGRPHRIHIMLIFSSAHMLVLRKALAVSDVFKRDVCKINEYIIKHLFSNYRPPKPPSRKFGGFGPSGSGPAPPPAGGCGCG